MGEEPRVPTEQEPSEQEQPEAEETSQPEREDLIATFKRILKGAKS